MLSGHCIGYDAKSRLMSRHAKAARIVRCLDNSFEIHALGEWCTMLDETMSISGTSAVWPPLMCNKVAVIMQNDGTIRGTPVVSLTRSLRYESSSQLSLVRYPGGTKADVENDCKFNDINWDSGRDITEKRLHTEGSIPSSR